MLGKSCVIYISVSSLHHLAVMGKSHSNLTLLKIYFEEKGVVSYPKNY